MKHLCSSTPVILSGKHTKSAGEGQLLAIDVREEEIPSASPHLLENSLRSLARWLVSAARKGAAVADSGPSAEGQIVLDVARDTEVVSKPEASEMPAQQVFQRGDRR